MNFSAGCQGDNKWLPEKDRCSTNNGKDVLVPKDPTLLLCPQNLSLRKNELKQIDLYLVRSGTDPSACQNAFSSLRDQRIPYTDIEFSSSQNKVKYQGNGYLLPEETGSDTLNFSFTPMGDPKVSKSFSVTVQDGSGGGPQGKYLSVWGGADKGGNPCSIKSGQAMCGISVVVDTDKLLSDHPDIKEVRIVNEDGLLVEKVQIGGKTVSIRIHVNGNPKGKKYYLLSEDPFSSSILDSITLRGECPGDSPWDNQRGVCQGGPGGGDPDGECEGPRTWMDWNTMECTMAESHCEVENLIGGRDLLNLWVQLGGSAIGSCGGGNIGNCCGAYGWRGDYCLPVPDHYPEHCKGEIEICLHWYDCEKERPGKPKDPEK